MAEFRVVIEKVPPKSGCGAAVGGLLVLGFLVWAVAKSNSSASHQGDNHQLAALDQEVAQARRTPPRPLPQATQGLEQPPGLPARQPSDPGAYAPATQGQTDTPSEAAEFIPRSFVAGSFGDNGLEEAKVQASIFRARGFPVQLRKGLVRGYYIICGPYPDDDALAEAMDRDRRMYPGVSPIVLSKKMGRNISF